MILLAGVFLAGLPLGSPALALGVESANSFTSGSRDITQTAITAATSEQTIAQTNVATIAATSASSAPCAFEFPNQNLCAALAWPTSASVGAEVKFQVQFRDLTSGAFRDPEGDVSLYLWMPMMGHGSRPVTIGHISGTGLYEISKAYFVMMGDWDLHLTIKNGATSEESIVSVHL